MKNSTRFFLMLTGYVVLLFIGGIAMTFVTEWLQQSRFFGDIPTRPWKIGNIVFTTDGAVDQDHEWGARHYWFFWLTALLFLISIVRIVLWAVSFWDDID